MSLLQVWLLIGVPTLAIALLLFLRRSTVFAVLGYAVLLAGFGLMLAFHPPSAAVLGALIALLYAAGRGGDFEAEPVPSYRDRAADRQESPHEA